MKAYIILSIIWIATTGNAAMENTLSRDLSLHSENLVNMFRDYLTDMDIHRDRRSLLESDGTLSRTDRQTKSSQTVQNFALWYDPSSGMRMCETKSNLTVESCLDANANCRDLNTSLGVCTKPNVAQKLGCLKTCNLCNDPCVVGRTKCHVNADCISTNGNVRCLCRSGYVGDGINTCQVDIDECKLGTHNCTESQVCENRLGYFLCADTVKEKKEQIACISGYEVQNGKCVDVNECKSKQHKCHRRATCINLVGGYRCSCNNGFVGNGKICIDVNECAKYSPCGKWAICVNTAGSFKCSCIKGFQFNGRVCEDVNECHAKRPCDTQAMCINAIGSYRCICKKGYYGNGKYCNDINECDHSDTNTCNRVKSKCQNTPGSYWCKCNAGYVMKHGKCQLKVVKIVVPRTRRSRRWWRFRRWG